MGVGEGDKAGDVSRGDHLACPFPEWEQLQAAGTALNLGSSAVGGRAESGPN